MSDHTCPSLASPHSSAAAAVVTPSVVSLQNRGNTGMGGDKRGISGSKDPPVSAKEALSDETSLVPNKVQRQLDNLDQANAEIERLRKMGDKISGELQGRTNFFFTLWFQLDHNMFQLIGTPKGIEQITYKGIFKGSCFYQRCS